MTGLGAEALNPKDGAPCNICGYGWPTHHERCAYRVNVEDLFAIREERDALAARLTQASEALWEIHMQATRRLRASDNKQYLVTDLEMIDKLALGASPAKRWAWGELASGGIRICKCGDTSLEDEMHLCSLAASSAGETRVTPEMRRG